MVENYMILCVFNLGPCGQDPLVIGQFVALLKERGGDFL